MINKTALLATAMSMLFSYAVQSQVITKESCSSTLHDLGLQVDGYDLKKGWLGTKHIFSGGIECSDKGGSMHIVFENKIYATAGFFGQKALEARDKTLSIQKEKIAGIGFERDQTIKQAKLDYNAAVEKLKGETQSLLIEIKEGNLPASILSEIQAERELEIEAKEIKAAKIAKAAAEKEKATAAAAAKEVEKLAKIEEEKIETKRKGFHCLSGWTGSQHYVVSAVKGRLNDPDSFKHVETRVAPVSNGEHFSQ